MRTSKYLVVIVLLTTLISCGVGSKKFVGDDVSYNWGWCPYYPEYASETGRKCTVNSGAIIFHCTIVQDEDEHKYVVKGYADASQGKLKSWSVMMDQGTRFSLLLSRDGKIVDNISFRPATALGKLSDNMPFMIEFTCPEGFDGINFYWNIYVRG